MTAAGGSFAPHPTRFGKEGLGGRSNSRRQPFDTVGVRRSHFDAIAAKSGVLIPNDPTTGRPLIQNRVGRWANGGETPRARSPSARPSRVMGARTRVRPGTTGDDRAGGADKIITPSVPTVPNFSMIVPMKKASKGKVLETRNARLARNGIAGMGR